MNGEHEISAGFHGSVICDVAPHFEGVGEEGVFGGGFFVFAVKGVEEAFGPGVAVVPVEGAGLREIWIGAGGCRVGDVAHKGVDPGFVVAGV